MLALTIERNREALARTLKGSYILKMKPSARAEAASPRKFASPTMGKASTGSGPKCMAIDVSLLAQRVGERRRERTTP